MQRLLTDQTGMQIVQAIQDISHSRNQMTKDQILQKLDASDQVGSVLTVTQDGVKWVVPSGTIPNASDIQDAVTDVLIGESGRELTDGEKVMAQNKIGFVTLTQEEYDLLDNKSESAIYIIVDGDTE